MSFMNIIFPEKISYHFSGGAKFNTEINYHINGKETRNIKWLLPRNHYVVNHKTKFGTEIEELKSFFYIVKGKGTSFLFKDWHDCKLKQSHIATGNGIQKEFNIIKTYSFKGHNFIRRITQPAYSTIKVYLNGTLQNSNSYSFNKTKSMLTFVTAPAIGTKIIVDCDFYIVARFDNDHCNITQESQNVFSWEDIKIIEVL